MTVIGNRRRWAKLSLSIAAAAFLLTVGFSANPAKAWYDRWHHWHGGYWHGGYWHPGYWGGTVYAPGYYYGAPPPVVYGPGVGVGISLPGVSIGLGF